MASLPFVLFLLFHLQARADIACLYHRPGDDVVLPSQTSRGCDRLVWTRDSSAVVGRDTTLERRLRRVSGCSLLIDDVAAEDAGCYSAGTDRLCLNVLNVSPSAADAEPQRGGEVALQCSLFRSTSYRDCGQSNILWLDETGLELLHEDDACEVAVGKCVSNLTVDADSGKTYTCQVMNDRYDVVVEANYTLEFTGSPGSTDSTGSAEWSPLSFVMLTLRLCLLVLMIVITVLIVVEKKKTERGHKRPRRGVSEQESERVSE